MLSVAKAIVLATALSPSEACIAKAVYMEARSDSPKGQAGVAALVLNISRDTGMTPCQVIKSRKFAPYWKAQRGSKFEHDAWNAAVDMARYVVASGYDPTGGATMFHSDAVSPGWGGVELSMRSRRHLFYVEVN